MTIQGRTAADYAETSDCIQAINDTNVRREADVEAKDVSQLVAAVTHRATTEQRLKALELVINQMNYCTDKLLRIDAPPPSVPLSPPTSMPPLPPVSARTQPSSASSSSTTTPPVAYTGPMWNAASWNNWFVDEYGRLLNWRDAILHDIVGTTTTTTTGPTLTPSTISSPTTTSTTIESLISPRRIP
jgi:hypothetical protein